MDIVLLRFRGQYEGTAVYEKSKIIQKITNYIDTILKYINYITYNGLFILERFVWISAD